MNIKESNLTLNAVSLLRKSNLIRIVARILLGRGGFRICKCCMCGSSGLHVKKLKKEKLVCIRCGSNGRQRALVTVMNEQFTGWEQMSIHESSPSGASFRLFTKFCPNYLPTYYWPDVQPGGNKNGFRCEDLQRQTFADCMFDLVLTQDVFEHIPDPAKAFQEVLRTLKPGGAHLFTVPLDGRKRSVRRNRYIGEKLIHLLKPNYHGDPINSNGSLVVTDWGLDIIDIVKDITGLDTYLLSIRDSKAGIEGRSQSDTHSHLFITRKPEY